MRVSQARYLGNSLMYIDRVCYVASQEQNPVVGQQVIGWGSDVKDCDSPATAQQPLHHCPSDAR